MGGRVDLWRFIKPSTIPSSLAGTSVIIDAATIRSTNSYTAEAVDGRGKLALIEAAKVAKIKKYIFFSIFNAAENANIPVVDLKLKIEKQLASSGLNYTIFQCSGFFQGLISQYALPVLENETIWLASESADIAYVDTQDAAKVVVQQLDSDQYKNSTVPLLGERFWSSKEVVELCERLSGKTANISYIPTFAFSILRNFFRGFEFTWNIADRLQFGEIRKVKNQPVNNVDWSFERLGLENYLSEYFGKILKKLRETNYQQSQKSNEISFL